MYWKTSQQLPVIYRQHIYYLSSSAHKDLFVANPHKYLLHNPPGPAHHVTLSIVGPPKSGKTTGRYAIATDYVGSDIDDIPGGIGFVY